MVNNGGNLIMNGGIISGNHADQDGGGVEVRRNGTFVMNGGTIKILQRTMEMVSALMLIIILTKPDISS